MQVMLPEPNATPSMVETPKTERKTSIVEEIKDLLKAADVAVKDNVDNQQKGVIDSCRPTPIHSHTPFPGISQLLPNLYLCGAGVAMPAILDQLEVRFIINVAPELPDTPLSSSSKPLYLRINVIDKPDVDLSSHFNEVADMIEEVRQHGGKSLVHCVAGVSRSATLCIAYLMRHMAMSLREAYLHVKAIRPQIRPNSGFFEQLRRYELQLRGESSVQLIYLASLDKEIPDVYEPEYRAMEDFYQRHRNAFKRR